MNFPKVALTLAFSILVLGLNSGCGAQHFGVEQGSNEFGQTVTYATEVDVLWVVDTSGSMAKRQNALAAQVPAFIQGLNATGLDYHIAVTSMDMGNGGARGKFLAQTGTPAVLTRATPNLIGLLMGRIQAGESGSPIERGREAVLSALKNTSQPFLRENALLNVIFLTDEEDESSTAVDYIAELDHMKPALPYGDRSWIAHFMGVMPNDSNCQTTDWNFSSPGLRYIELANASGGSKETICDANFQRALLNVRSRVLSMLTEFKLDRAPVIETIKVLVNGVEVPKGDVDGWSYYKPANSVRFHGAAVPPAGARIKVTFDPEGLK